jgi:hypothetical protein
MYIFQEATTPQGAVATCHRVHRIDLNPQKITVTISSYANEMTDMLVWQDAHEMPLADFQAEAYPDNVYRWLTGPFGPFSGAVLVSDVEEIVKLRIQRKTMVNTIRDRKIAEGCNTPSGVVDTDDKSLRNIMAVYQAASLALLTDSPFQVTWRLKDNTEVVLGASDVLAVGNAVLAHIQACYARSWVLKQEIDEAETEQEIDAVLIGIGWTA